MKRLRVQPRREGRLQMSLERCNSRKCLNVLRYRVPNIGRGNGETTVSQLGLGMLRPQSYLVSTRPCTMNSLTTCQFSGQIWRLPISQCSIDGYCQLVCNTFTHWQHQDPPLGLIAHQVPASGPTLGDDHNVAKWCTILIDSHKVRTSLFSWVNQWISATKVYWVLKRLCSKDRNNSVKIRWYITKYPMSRSEKWVNMS